MALPRLDRNAYVEQMRVEFERALREVADAVDGAPQGRVIRDSEVNAAEAAFPPSEQRDDGKEETA